MKDVSTLESERLGRPDAGTNALNPPR
jgi:hypothetical protein